MTLPVLNNATLYVPYALASNLEAAVNPSYVLNYAIPYSNFVNIVDADIYCINTPYTEVFPNDTFGMQEDFNFLNNRLWNLKKVISSHSLTPSTATDKILLDEIQQDSTLGNRSFGFPLLIYNKSNELKTFRMSMHHSIAAKIEFLSMVDGSNNTAIFTVEKISPALNRSENLEVDDIWSNNTSIIKKDYEIFNDDDRFSVGKLSQIDDRIILIGEKLPIANKLSIPDNIYFSRDTINVSDLNYIYGKIISHDSSNESYTIEFWDKTYSNKIDISETELEKYKIFTPHNQLIKIINLGKGEFEYDSSGLTVIKENSAKITYKTTAESKGIYDWTYFYPTSHGINDSGSKRNNVFAQYAFDGIDIELKSNEFRIIHISVIKMNIASSFSCGISIGLMEV